MARGFRGGFRRLVAAGPFRALFIPTGFPCMKIIRRLYDWVLHWADTPYGMTALVLIAFAESSFFPIPPDVLLIALCLGRREKWARFASACAVASVAGGIAGYAIGWGVWQAVDQFFFAYVPGFSEQAFERVSQLYDKYNFWVVFAAAFTPIPFKVFTIAAGVFGINFPMFVIAAAVGRSARFFLVAGMLRLFGKPIEKFIDRWFNLLSILFFVCLIGGFVVLKFFLEH